MSSGLNKELREKHAVSGQVPYGSGIFALVEIRVGFGYAWRDQSSRDDQDARTHCDFELDLDLLEDCRSGFIPRLLLTDLTYCSNCCRSDLCPSERTTRF